MTTRVRFTIVSIALAFAGAIALNACGPTPDDNGATVASETTSDEDGGTCIDSDPIDDSVPSDPNDGDTCEVCTCPTEDVGTVQRFDCVHVGKSPARKAAEAQCSKDYIAEGLKAKAKDKACLLACCGSGPLYPICAGACKTALVADFATATYTYHQCMQAAAAADPICPICKK